MMTPVQFKSHRFQAAGRGAYRTYEVDEFFASAADNYEQLYRENQDKTKKLGILADSIEKYRQEEDIIKKTLINAQRLADTMVNEAREQAKSIVDESTGKAADDANRIRNDAEAYAKRVTAEAESFLERSKTEYESRMAIVSDRAKDIIDSANKTAEQIVSDSKIKCAAAVEKANSELSELEAESARLTSHAQTKLDTIRSMTVRFKKDMLDVIARQSALVEAISVADSDYEAPKVSSDCFKAVTSDVEQSSDFVAQPFNEEKLFGESSAKASPVPEKPVTKAETATKAEPAAKAEPVIQKPAFSFTEEPAEVVVTEEKPEPVFAQKPKLQFEDISSNGKAQPEKKPEPQGKDLSFEEAQSQPDLLEMIEQRVKQELDDVVAEVPENIGSFLNNSESDDDDENYTQPSLFEGQSASQKFRSRMAEYVNNSLDDRQDDDEFSQSDDDDDYDDEDDSVFNDEIVTRKGEPLMFGKKYDIFEQDKKGGKHKKKK